MNKMTELKHNWDLMGMCDDNWIRSLIKAVRKTYGKPTRIHKEYWW